MTKQLDQQAVSAAIAKAEKILAYDIDDATYNKESFKNIPFIAVAWAYLITELRLSYIGENIGSVEEEKENAKAIAKINEAYNEEKHTKTMQDIEISINENSTEEDKARALLKMYVIDERVDLVAPLITEIYLLGSELRELSPEYFNFTRGKVNERYKKELILSSLNDYTDKAEKIIGYSLKNSLSADEYEYIHVYIMLAWQFLKLQSLGCGSPNVEYKEIFKYPQAINDKYNREKHTTPLECVELTANENSDELDKARVLLKHYILQPNPWEAVEMSEKICQLLKTKGKIISIEEFEEITDYINDRYQEYIEK